MIISDNASDEDVESYISSLNEPRIRYFRVNTFISVTENWNNALANANGDYVIMLGDDDGLLKGSLSSLIEHIETWESPDVIYFSALLYAWPNTISEYKRGYCHQLGCAEFFKINNEPYILPADEAMKYVKGAMNFRALFDFNMQFVLVSRKFVNSLNSYGAFYQSSFPDYYAMNAIFLKAKDILIVPSPLVAIGISPKSYGYYYGSQKEGVGRALLNNNEVNSSSINSTVLPGSDINTCWLYAMEALENNYNDEFNFNINKARYRLLQIVDVIINTRWLGLKKLLPLLSIREKGFFAPIIVAMLLIKSLSEKRYNYLINKILDSIRPYPLLNPSRIDGAYENIVELCKEDIGLLLSKINYDV